MQKWVKMPSRWLRDTQVLQLKQMRWSGPNKSDNIAALMIYIVLVQNACVETDIENTEVGVCSLTYDQLNDITGLSKSKISNALKLLINFDLIEKVSHGKTKSRYRISGFGAASGWAKLPALGLYDDNKIRIPIFHDFNLRKKNELNTLKLYLLIIAFRDNTLNYTQISYKKINEYTGIQANEIRLAISLLINYGLVQLGKGAGDGIKNLNAHNIYKPNYIDTYKNTAVIESDPKIQFL